MLTDDQLREAHAAAIALKLDREALLAAFDRPLVVQLRASTNETAQFWDDLCALRRTGSTFLRTWLDTAAQFARPRVEAKLFRELSKQLSAALGARDKPQWVGAWVGRTGEMAALAEALVTSRGAPKPVAICALQGMAGVGKTYLAERFSWEHAEAFPGGVRRLAMRPDEAPTATSLLAELAAQLDAPAANPAELRARLLVPRALVHVDNADDAKAAEAAADLARALQGCALVVTGRYGSLGDDGVWTVVNVAPFDETTAMAQLAAEFRPPEPEQRAAFARLTRELGYLPLALSLAAAHLRDGLSPDQFLALLREDRLDIDHPNAAKGDADARRRNVSKTLSLSLGLLQRSLGARGEELLQAFCAFGHAPAAGVGASLGAAITGLSAVDFLRLAMTATRLSVLDRIASEPPRWRMHPLLAELVRSRTDAKEVVERTTAWFVARLPKKSDADPRPQGERWTEVHAETGALVDWLARLPAAAMPAVERAGSRYAQQAGPFAVWASFCERLLAAHEDSQTRSHALWTLGNVAQRMGEPNRAFDAAREKGELDLAAGRERGAALAASLRADIWQARGQLDEALRIRKEDQLPVFEKLGDIRSRAVTLGKIADIFKARGQLDEALRIRTDDQLPVFEKLGDIRERAVTLGKIADIFEARGQLDEAIRIRTDDQLPVFEKLGDIRERAVTMGKIADILQACGQLDEAIRIYRADVLPVEEGLGDRRLLLVHRTYLASYLAARGEPADRNEAEGLLRLALAAAVDMALPEAAQIRGILAGYGFEV
jgi:tetratricopeptide (TPR) repeat protein